MVPLIGPLFLFAHALHLLEFVPPTRGVAKHSDALLTTRTNNSVMLRAWVTWFHDPDQHVPRMKTTEAKAATIRNT